MASTVAPLKHATSTRAPTGMRKVAGHEAWKSLGQHVAAARLKNISSCAVHAVRQGRNFTLKIKFDESISSYLSIKRAESKRAVNPGVNVQQPAMRNTTALRMRANATRDATTV